MRRLLALLLLCSTGACRPGGEGHAPESPEPPREDAPPDNDPGKGADLEDSCGRGSETFPDHGWAPVDARLLASIRLDAADLDPALGHLERVAREDGNGLPITAGFTLSQLRLEVSILRDQLAAAGFRPAELVRIASPEGALAWVFPITCDLGQAKLRAGAAWKLDLRITTDGTVGEPRAGEDPPFPYTALFLPGDRVALVPTNHADAARSWLRGRATTPGSEAGAEPPGARLDDLRPAAVRVVFGGRAFVSGDAATDPPKALRATGDGVEIDGSLRPAP